MGTPSRYSPHQCTGGSFHGPFTVHPQKTNSDQFQAIDEEPELQRKLQKLLVPAARMNSIRFHLDRCGVNNATIYPDLDGLARHIEWCNSYLEDESSW